MPKLTQVRINDDRLGRPVIVRPGDRVSFTSYGSGGHFVNGIVDTIRTRPGAVTPAGRVTITVRVLSSRGTAMIGALPHNTYKVSETLYRL